jgi:hypothetical protein
MLVLLALLGGGTAHAQDRATAPSSEPVSTVEQPFLFLNDPHGPGPKHVVAGYGLAFSSSPGAIRPIPGNFDGEAVVHAVSLDVGVARRLDVFATGLLAQPVGDASRIAAVAVKAGGRVLLTRPESRQWRVAIEAAYLREFGPANGLYGEVTGTFDVGRVRLAAAAHVEHVFDAARDPVDLYAVAGVSVRILDQLRLGAEYVLQDLEAAFDDDHDAEKGVRQYVGPNVALAFANRHVLVTGGVAAELAQQPGLLGRVSLAFAY